MTGEMEKNRAKYPKIYATVETILQAIPSSYMVESGLCALSIRQTEGLITEHSNLGLKFTKLQPNICDLFSAKQTYFSPL